MVVWGGLFRSGDALVDLNDGARYDPATDLWQILSAAPPDLAGPAVVVWTGQEMIVRTDRVPEGPAIMAAYNPTDDKWRAIRGGPTDTREGYSFLWTGTELILWGGATGEGLAGPALGAVYNPTTDTRHGISAAPITPRTGHQTVWTGEEMIIWGGRGSCSGGDSTCVTDLTDGAAYRPATDTWRTLPPPTGLTSSAVTVWDGTRMLAWSSGECVQPCMVGVSYDPASDSWAPLPDPLDSTVTNPYRALSTGNEVLLWDWHGSVSAYQPATGSWRTLPTGPGADRRYHTLLCTGQTVLVWGGWNGAAFTPPRNDGAALDPTK